MSREMTTESRRPMVGARQRLTYDRKLVKEIRKEGGVRWTELRVVSVLDWIHARLNEARRADDREVKINLGEFGRADRALYTGFARFFPAVSQRSVKDQPTPLQDAILATVLDGCGLQSPKIVHVRSSPRANNAFIVLHTEEWV